MIDMKYSYHQLVVTIVLALLTFAIPTALFANEAGEKVTFYHHDHLGSVVMATDENASIEWKREYEAFGKPQYNGDTSVTGFTGHQFSPESGLNYMLARWYEPELGRFLSPDPILYHANNPSTFNRYAYARNSPFSFVDPDGRAPITAPPFCGFEDGCLSPLDQTNAILMEAAGGSGGVRSSARLAKLKLPNQMHHFATNKSKTYTPRMKKIIEKYGLDLDGDWNKELLPHRGRHPNNYHDLVERGMTRAAKEAGDSVEEFLRLFEKYVKEPIRKNPELLRKSGWD